MENWFLKTFKCIFNIKTNYYFEPFIYIDDNSEVVYGDISDKIKWLEKFTIQDCSEYKASEKAFELVNKEYKEYKGAIWFF